MAGDDPAKTAVGHGRLLRVSRVAITVVTTAATTVAAILTTLYLVVPNLSPSTTNQADIKDIYVEQSVPLRQYLTDDDIVLSLQHNVATRNKLTRFEAGNPGALTAVGSVVDFQYSVIGYRGHPLTVRWTVLDAQDGHRLAESKDYDLLPLQFTAQKRDGDLGSWEIWVNGDIAHGRAVVLMIALYDDSVGTRLSYLVTDRFILA